MFTAFRQGRILGAFLLGAALAGGTVLLLQPSAVQAQTGANQPMMQSALSSLIEAKGFLERGATNKGGHRVKALDYVNRAIVEVQSGMAVAN